jgi:alpha-tubulin suppressor-like RCC1 family protein
LVTARREGAKAVLAEIDGYFVAILVGVSNSLHPVASVTVSADSASVAPGNILRVAAIARDADGNLLQRRIAQWSSSNPNVARVSASTNDQIPGTSPSDAWLGAFFAPPTSIYAAEVSGFGNGVVRIVASIEGKSDTIVVTVTSSATIAGLVLTSDTATLVLRETKQLSAASVNSAGGRAPIAASQIQWESSNPSVATVDANGIAAGIGAGSATITGRWNNHSASVRVTVEEIAFETISTGATHACALTAGGATYCWGANDFGQAGRPGVIGGPIIGPALTFKPVPMRVAEGFTFVALTSGGLHTCGLTAAGAAYCWGLNRYGALGSGNFDDSWRPVAVTGGLTFRNIEAGTYQTCGVTTAGSAYCWGSLHPVPFGSAIPASNASPAPVTGGIAFATLSSGGSHTCGLTADGVAYCWGDNAAGQLGAGDGVTSSATPLPVSGGLTFATITAGESHTCGVTRNGQLYCWGWNFDDQLGNGIPSTPSSTPTAVASSLSFTTIGAASSHTCAIDVSSVMYCWGRNSDGQIGLGTATSELFATPQRVGGGIAFDRLSTGRSHTCAGTAAGVWYCWGDNESGALGVGNTTDSGTPLKVLGQP